MKRIQATPEASTSTRALAQLQINKTQQQNVNNCAPKQRTVNFLHGTKMMFVFVTSYPSPPLLRPQKDSHLSHYDKLV